MKGNVLSRLFTGLVIIGIGVVFLMQQTGYITLSIGELISSFWPVILIIIGLKQIMTQDRHGGGWWGLMMLAMGVIFLGRNLEWFDWSIGDLFRYLVPIIIIGVGLRMMFRPKASPQEPKQEEWEYYRPYSDQQADVPPAPPLHPDPTKPVEPNRRENDDKYAANFDEHAKASSGASYERSKQHHDKQYHAEESNAAQDFEDSFTKENFHKYKRQFKEYRRDYKRNKHVYEDGWWDYKNGKTENRSGFIGDIHIGHDYWELKPMNISHFIGDTVLDLTKANVPVTETRINISSFIGDVKVYVPNDYEIAVQVVSSAFIGDVKILGQREGGIFTNVNIESPMYREADKKIKIVVSTFIGDVRVTKVG